MRKLALIAHDNKKVDLVAWATYNRGAVALPRAAVHTGERRWLQGGNPLQQRARIARVRVVVERHPHRLAGLEDVGFGHGRVARARLGEEIAAEEGLRPGLEQVAAFP